jgi:arylsulfatase A-like enzyme
MRLSHFLLPLCVLALFAGTLNAAETKPPHIIFALADDMGLGDVACFGGTLAATPNIDQLAKDGTRFTQFYVAAPICSPSRCGLITGQFPARWRITSYLQTRAGNAGCEQADFLDAKAPSLPRQLKSAGYATAHFGKWHLGGGRDVENPPKFAAYGYDESAGTWESPEPHPDITATNWIWSDKDKVKRWERSGFFVDKTLDFLKRHKDQPCFVNLWFDDVHTPWVPRAGAPKGDTPDNLKPVIIELDRQMGRLVAGLRELGIEQNTLIIFTGDNGPLPTFKGARSGGFRGSKMSLYEAGSREPFIVRWPGRTPAGKTDDQTVISAVDMLPTLCAIGSAKLPDGYAPDGQDMTAAFMGTPIGQRKMPLMWEYGRNEKFFAYPKIEKDRSPNLAIRDGKWKLLINADGKGAELYDLLVDPRESKNVAERNPEVTARLSKQVLEWRKSLP